MGGNSFFAMQISRTDELELLTVLHDGMHEQPAWGTFLGRLVRRVGATGARLLLARGEAGLQFRAQANTRQIIVRARSTSEPDDPVPYGSLRPHRVYSLSELQSPPGVAGRIVRAGADDLDGWLAILSEEEDFTPSAGALLTALAPHLSIAFRNYAAVERDRLERRVGDWALGRLGRGWLALTATGRVVAADELGEKVLREGVHLRRSAERRLLAASPVAHQRLMRAIETVASDTRASPRAVRIAEDPQLELLITPIAAEASDAPMIGASVAAHIQIPPPVGADPATALGELFDLSPAVARFAWALGRTGGIAESAEQLGLTIETARFYSKTLYAKLGVKGQAELARRILTSAAVLA
jgi:hypothetical protein